MRTLLICHEGAALHERGIAGWLASFSDLAGVVVLREPPRSAWRRAKWEIRRVGLLRFLDVLAFRAYYRLRIAHADEAWKATALARLEARFPPPAVVPFMAGSVNSAETERYVRACAPDVVIALCKTLLKPNIFSIPGSGTFVMHPGICPEYRNAHGSFWALANGDTGKVGLTLLRIDAGIDTGPVYGYFRCAVDECAESHVRIQTRLLVENLDALRDKLAEIVAGRAIPLDTRGRASATWGQPWLTRYLAWKRRARRRRRRENAVAAVS